MPSIHVSSPPYNNYEPGYFDSPEEPEPEGQAYEDKLLEKEPISVAEQKEAGVPADDTVTIAEQKGGEEAPALPVPELDAKPEEETSAGTSSSTSEKKRGRNGNSTTSARQSPAQGAESRSGKDPAA
jgi:hypothetical protein